MTTAELNDLRRPVNIVLHKRGTLMHLTVLSPRGWNERKLGILMFSLGHDWQKSLNLIHPILGERNLINIQACRELLAQIYTKQKFL